MHNANPVAPASEELERTRPNQGCGAWLLGLFLLLRYHNRTQRSWLAGVGLRGSASADAGDKSESTL